MGRCAAMRLAPHSLSLCLTMNNETLVFDIGDDIIGIFSVMDSKYIPYRGNKMIAAVERLLQANEIVSYNGKNYDIERMNQLFDGAFEEFSGVHSDMREVCWSDRIWGSSLRDTYAPCGRIVVA